MYLVVFQIIILLVLCFVALLVRKYSAIRKIPGPSWLETMKLFIFFNEDIYRYIITLPEKYGPVLKVWVKPFKTVLLIADPKYFQHILTSKEHIQKPNMYGLMYAATGNGLTADLDVQHWKAERKMLNNVFNHQNVSRSLQIFKYHADKLRTEIEIHENTALDVHLPINRWALDVILEYLTNDSMDEKVAIAMIRNLDKFFELYLERSYSMCSSNDTVFRFSNKYKPWIECCSVIDEICKNILQKQRTLNNHTIKRDKNNFIKLILESNNTEYSILSQLKTFILAGFTTTSITVAFGLFEIAKRPDVQESILQEHLSAIGTDESAVTFSQLQSMTYTEAVVKEVMRIYPSVPLIQRKLQAPVVIDGWTIPADTNVIFSIPSLHNLHFPHPKKFQPERFLPENISNIDPYEYAPFSLGPRDCIGKKLAMVEMKFIFSYIVKHFTLHPVEPEHELDIAGEFSLRSRNGVPIIFKKRN